MTTPDPTPSPKSKLAGRLIILGFAVLVLLYLVPLFISELNGPAKP